MSDSVRPLTRRVQIRLLTDAWRKRVPRRVSLPEPRDWRAFCGELFELRPEFLAHFWPKRNEGRPSINEVTGFGRGE
jgi:hypothetical protein